ncbi:MAG: type II toxin-antitoxin system RelE/ParE family toxin [Alphaproteobacteria bacterium]|jgi:proteic killer suppression protein|nr:type II toxin-antitoxin system RelE/ParE family toxin [Alphaproteobacteria bacterium]
MKRWKHGLAEEIASGRFDKRFPADLRKVARRKVLMVLHAATLADQRIPPANRLEQLAGDRAGQHSIRINDQYRVCFRWSETDGACEIEVVDDH